MLRECECSGLPVWIQKRSCLYKQMKIITDPSPAKKGKTTRAQKSLAWVAILDIVQCALRQNYIREMAMIFLKKI